MDEYYDDYFYNEDDYDVSKLQYVYREDKYHLADGVTGQLFDVSEYFIVAGEHSVMRLLDIESGEIIIECYNRTITYKLDDPTVDRINAMRDAIMIYDYCVDTLRKMPINKALKSPICELKFKIENEFLDENPDFLTAFQDSHLLKEFAEPLIERCNYLKNALYAEWKGIVSHEHIQDFETPDQLDSYIENHDLLTTGEGEDKTVEEYRFFKNIRDAYRNNPSDYLGFVRPYKNEVFRIKMFKHLSEEDLFEEQKRNRKYDKSTAKCKTIISTALRMQQKIDMGACRPFQEKIYESQINRLNNKLVKASCMGVFDLIR